jgi:hypothetical protein
MLHENLSILVPLALATSACGGKVVVDANTTSGTGTGGASTNQSASSGTGVGGGAGSGFNAIVTRGLAGPCVASAMTIPPGDVFLLVASQPIACGATLPAGFTNPECAPTPFNWELCFAFAPSALTPNTWAFLGVEDPLHSSESDVGGCAGHCCASESFFPTAGTLTITAATASSVSFTLEGTTGVAGFDGNGTIDADGSYVAPRCP